MSGRKSMAVPPGVGTSRASMSFSGWKYSYENTHKATLTNTVLFKFQKASCFPLCIPSFKHTCTHMHTRTHVRKHKLVASQPHALLNCCLLCLFLIQIISSWTIIPWGNEFHLFLSSWYSLCLEGCLANWRLYVHHTYKHTCLKTQTMCKQHIYIAHIYAHTVLLSQ